MCLAIPANPGDVDETNRLAKVDVAEFGGTSTSDSSTPRRWAEVGDWVLIHVGFRDLEVDEDEAVATRRCWRMGADYEAELEELRRA